MRFDRSGVDGQSHAVLAAAGERFKDRLPMSALSPPIETIVDRGVRTIVGRAIAPARAASGRSDEKAALRAKQQTFADLNNETV